MATIPVTFVVADDVVPFGNPLENVVVRAYNEAGDTFITEGLTDAAGELVLLLEDMTTFWVRFFKVGYSFPTKLRITADSAASSNTFDVSGHNLEELPPSTVPELCRASGWVVNAAGEPTGGATFEFNVTDLPKVVAGRAVVRSKVIAVSRKDGYVEVELVRGGVYDVIAEASEDTPIRVKVPDKGAIGFTDLIWPYTAKAQFTPSGPINLAKDATIEVALAVILSSCVETPYDLDGDDRRRFGHYIHLDLSGDAVVGMSINEETDILTLTGLEVGTATLTTSLREDNMEPVEAKRLPEPTRDLQELVINVV